MSQATSGMREVGSDGAFYLRVGTQWVKVGIPLLSLAVLAALLTSCTVCTAAAWQCKLSQIPNTTKLAMGTEPCKAQKSMEANAPALQRTVFNSSSDVLSDRHMTLATGLRSANHVVQTSQCTVSKCVSDLQQLRLTPDELEAIVTRLNTQPRREIKKGHEPPQARVMKLVYHKDAAKGYKEAYVPVKRVGAYFFQALEAMTAVVHM